MPDVGVLNLQIQENSESAVGGLDKLVDALRRVKDAVGDGLKLSPIATGLKNIAKVVDENIHGSTIVKIGQLADELSKLKGVGNVNIRISGSETVEAVRDAAKETKEALGGINTGFDDIAPRAGQVMETAEAVKELHDSIVSVANEKIDYSKLDLNKFLATPLEALTERYRQTGGAASDFSERVSAAIPVLQEYRDTVLGLESKKDIAGFSKKTGEELVASMKAASESAKKVTEETAKGMTVAAEEVQQAVGTTVASTEEIVERTVSAEEEYAKQFDEICERMKERAEEANAIRKEQESEFYKPAMSMEQTNSMADQLTQLDLLQAQLREAQKKYNELVNSLGKDNVKSIKAGLSVSDLRDKIWAYKDALREANSESTATVSATDTVRDQFESEASSISEATEAAREQTESLKKTADAAKEVSDKVKSSGFSFKDFKKSIKSMFPLLDRLLKKLGSQIITRSIRYAIRAVTSGIKEGVENVYYYSKAINSSFAPSLDSAASALQTMKNSLGAAAAPLIQSLIPAMQTLVNLFIEAVNWVNQFISLLRGQATWTKAVPATATAFEKQEKAAKKTSNALKDLLADWDELNIIQSESGGTGSPFGTTTGEDYLSMFEEVKTFDGRIKEIVTWIQDHMELVKGIAIAIGTAILGWKVSRAFGDMIKGLRTIIAGGALIAVGLQLSYAAGTQAGLNGEFDADTFLTAAAGAISSAIGGALIGFKVAGPWGAVIGAGAGFALSVATTVKAYIDADKQRRWAAKWGKVHLTDEQIADLVDTEITAEAKAWIELADISIKNREGARMRANETIKQFSINLDSAKYLLEADSSPEGVNAAVESAKEAIKAINESLTTEQEGLKISFTKFTYKDQQGNDITKELYSNLNQGTTAMQGFFNDIGADIARYISEGYQNGLDSEEYIMGMKLMDTFNNMMDNAEREYQKSKLLRDTNEAIGQLDGKWDEETAKKVQEQQNKALWDYKNAVMGQWKEDIEYYDRYIAYAKEAVKYFDEIGNEEKKAEFEGYVAQATAALENTQEWLGSAKKGTYNWQLNDETYKEMVETMRQGWIERIREWFGEDEMKTIQNKGVSWFDVSDVTGEAYNPVLRKIGQMFNIQPMDLFNDEEIESFYKIAAESAQKRYEDGGGQYDLLELYKDELANRYLDFNNYAMGFISDLTPVTEEEREKAKNDLVWALKEYGPETDVESIIGRLYGSGAREDILEYIRSIYQQEQVDALVDTVNNLMDYGYSLDDAMAYIKNFGLDDTTLDTVREIIELSDKKPKFDTSGASDAASDYEDMASRIRAAFQSLDGLSFSMDMTGTSGTLTVHMPPIPMAATGAFVRSGDLVMANENGDFEMMGRMGNQPVIANNQQIVDGISTGVSNANEDVVSELRGLGNLLRQMINTGLVAKVVPSSSMGRNNNRSAEAYDRVTG